MKNKSMFWVFFVLVFVQWKTIVQGGEWWLLCLLRGCWEINEWIFGNCLKVEPIIWIILFNAEITHKEPSGGMKPLLSSGSLTNYGYHLWTRDSLSGFWVSPLCIRGCKSFCCERTSIKENQWAHGLQENVEQPHLGRTGIYQILGNN